MSQSSSDKQTDDFDNLQQIFPHWDKVTLFAVYEANHFSLNETVASVLAMEEPPVTTATTVLASDSAISNSNVTTAAPLIGEPTRPTAAEANQYSPAIPVAHASGESDSTLTKAKESDTNYRGERCVLPDDFLRPPGWSSQYYADEQLALNLQRELAQQEQEEEQQRKRNSSINQKYASPSIVDPIPDLGIFKAISAFGESAMKNIDYMVSRVSNMAKSDETPASNRAGESAEALTGNSTVGAPLIQHTSATSSSTAVRPAVSTEGTSKDPSQRSLLHDEWDADDEEDDAEIINFKSATKL